jgi:hypothetical protein
MPTPGQKDGGSFFGGLISLPGLSIKVHIHPHPSRQQRKSSLDR